MAFGPTQNYDDASLGRWMPHPALAAVVRGTLRAAPVVLVLAVGLAAARWAPPERLGMHPWLWLLTQVAISTALLLAAGRVTRRLLPLASLLRLTMVFPDRAPSRLTVAARHYSPEVLRRHLAARRPHESSGDAPQAELLLRLVGEINAHDRVTRAHSERVQAYSALIARELGLSAESTARLSWAALLHDVGKLRVPREILTKAGRPDATEWSTLADHPEHGMEIAAPLASWLGPWLDAIGQHHERWDGRGYPAGLAGTEISTAARIVAVADAYDVITSARPYKKPLSAAAARAELARCAGTQFDPDVVRAFLSVGLGRLRVVAGPVALVAALPHLPSMPFPSVGATLATTTSSANAVLTATAVGAAVTLTSPVVAPAAGTEPTIVTVDEAGGQPADASDLEGTGTAPGPGRGTSPEPPTIPGSDQQPPQTGPSDPDVVPSEARGDGDGSVDPSPEPGGGPGTGSSPTATPVPGPGRVPSTRPTTPASQAPPTAPPVAPPATSTPRPPVAPPATSTPRPSADPGGAGSPATPNAPGRSDPPESPGGPPSPGTKPAAPPAGTGPSIPPRDPPHPAGSADRPGKADEPGDAGTSGGGPQDG